MSEVLQTTAGRTGLSPEGACAILSDPAHRDVFDRLVRLAKVSLRAPTVLLSVVNEDRLDIISEQGVPEPWRSAGHLPLEATFCQFALEAKSVFAVNDVANHPSAFRIPRLENFSRVSYIGAPIMFDDAGIGVISVSDVQPRTWGADDHAAIRDLAAAVQRDIELLSVEDHPVYLKPRRRAKDSSRVAAIVVEPDATPDGVIRLDGQGLIVSVNPRAEELLGCARADVRGRQLADFCPQLSDTTIQRLEKEFSDDAASAELEEFLPATQRWIELRAFGTNDGGTVLYLRDITGRRQAEEELRTREARYHVLFEKSVTPMFLMSKGGRFIEVNRALEDLLGRSRLELQDVTLAELCDEPQAAESVLKPLRDHGAARDIEILLRRSDGEEMLCQVTATSNAGYEDVTYHGVVRDITASRRTQDALVKSALHDALTGLPNRVVFMDRLERILKHAKRRSGHRFAVLFVDLDKFKVVNDTLGHHAGDQLLIGVARRMESCVRDDDTVARIGGDEFAVLLDSIHDEASVTIIVDRIREKLAKPYPNIGNESGATVSIGIALSLSGYDRAEDVLKDADEAMYRAKAAGRNHYVIFDEQMQERAIVQRQLESDLRGAMTGDQFALHYHPVVELDGGSVTGLEALVRWTHPKRGILLPAEFMPLAESTGMIVEIGWWVLREACRQLRAWQLDFPDTAIKLTMSVNLSAKQFVHPQLVTRIDEILRDTGLDPHCLRLDLTEAVVMNNATLAARLLSALRERGIQICIDDFGTGYTSLPQLREFPISTLKIDRSFIDKIGNCGQSQEIVETIVALGKAMAIESVAEGVETPEQLEQLRKLGARFAQGFLFSLPLDTPATSRLLRETA
jgi:diguanylate cyclase (GGDEF)-like protein/PAS domain S-box-containing protein